ncbi:MAG: hypothetical protein M1562_01900 [Candidatus Marsarchaeota archaeon]|nr:hypothetical protein [Candidatus Marsarchaeota archaeon]
MDFRYIGVFLILSLSVVALSHAQLGEQAGQPTMYVNVSSSSTFSYYILNGGSSPISFKVIPPSLNSIPHNTTPTVVITPMSGTIMPSSDQKVSINVSMPSGDKPGLKWEGIVQVVEATPTNVTTSGEGAVITAGVAKLLTIYSTVPKPTPFYYIIIIVIVIVILVAAASVILFKRRKRSRTAIVAKAHRTAASIRSARREGSRGTGRPGRTRRAKRKSSRGTASASRGRAARSASASRRGATRRRARR